MQLNIKGKDWKLVWGTGAFEQACNELDMSFEELNEALFTGNVSIGNRFAYCALQNGAEIEDKTLDFNYKTFLAWFDEQEEGIGMEISNDFLKSKYLGKTMEDRYNEVIERYLATKEPTTTTTPKVKKKNSRSVKLSLTPTSGG